MKPIYLIIASLLLCASVTSCGSSSGPANLQIELSPSAPTLAVNSSVVISAQTTPALTAHLSTMTWSVAGSSGGCTEGVADPSIAPAMPGCPNGWIAWALTPSEFPPETVYYYSPATAGSYQVSVEGKIMNNNQQVTFQGTASAAVTVTAQ